MRPLKFLLRFLVFMVVLAAICEGWFRAVMPASEYPLSQQDARTAIDRYDPAGLAEGTYTVGRQARRGGRWRVNNEGWISAIDYEASDERNKPLVAILGDSYIEGFLSDVDQHVDAVLPAMLMSQYDVYAFGKSGLYLEQYVAMARYISSEFKPSLLVIFVNSGDVTSSLVQRGAGSSQRFRVDRSATGFVEVPAALRAEPAWRKVLKRAVLGSATLRYLLFNAKLPLPGGEDPATVDVNPEDRPPQGSEDASLSTHAADSETQDLGSAAAFMVGRLVSDHPGVPIVFVGDGQRYLAADEVDRARMDPDVAAIRKASESFPQCHFLDLRQVFAADWQARGKKFESVDGHHWSAYGNQLVAQALAQFLISQGLAESGPQAVSAPPAQVAKAQL